MKTLATLLLMTVGLTAVAQQYSFHQEIDDDGKHLKIRVDMVDKGHTVHYSNTFNVSGMSKQEKEELISRTLDSVKNDQSKGKRYVAQAPQTPQPHGWTTVEGAPAAAGGVKPSDSGATASSGESMDRPLPFQKSVEEDTEAKRIKVRYEYFENGEEHIFERTINTDGRTEREVKRLIEETERCLGLSSKSV